MKRFVALTSFLAFACTCFSQTVVNTTGNTISTADYTFEYSIGEVSITTLQETVNPTNFFITQGLLQPQVKFVNPACEIINDTVQFFPNPTRNILSVVSRYDWITSYVIYAADGKLVRFAPFINNQIDISALANAVYFIKLFPGCDNKYRVLKVIKQ